MPTNLIFFVILFAFTLLILTIFLLRKDKITVKGNDSTLSVADKTKLTFSGVKKVTVNDVIISIANGASQLANLFGFELLSNMVLCMFIGVLLLITLALTVMVTGLKKRTTLLIQEISLLKKELEDKK